MRNVGYSAGAILTADGCVSAVGTLASDDCCPIDVCNLDACNLMCAFIQLMPSGPLWDVPKARAMERYQNLPCAPVCAPDPGSCSSLVDYAVYSGYRLAELLRGPLWASIRESSPYTAVETIDSQLNVYGWTDCWESACRDQRLGPSPFECGVFEPGLDSCDANFSPIYVPTIPEPLNTAVKRGVLIAMHRLAMAPIKNLCGINWIIEPLGAYLRPKEGISADQCCTGLRWEICNISDTIEGVPSLSCSAEKIKRVKASFEMPTLAFNTATGRCEPVGPDMLMIWPAIMAAQCIAISLLPAKTCEVPISRCEGLN
jgi:hypothetical protein